MRQLVIDQDMLRRMDACREGRQDFARDYPDGLILTDDQDVNLQTLLNAPDSAWVLECPVYGTLAFNRLGWLLLMLQNGLPARARGLVYAASDYQHFGPNRWTPAYYAPAFALVIGLMKRHP